MTISCDEVELMLVSGEGLSADASLHLGHCEKCRGFQRDAAQVIFNASLPAPSAEERAALSALAPKLHLEWKRSERRRGFVRRTLGLAMAACFGAAIASAALLPRLQTQAPLRADTPTEWSVDTAELAGSTDAPDELESFEVSWPSAE